MRHVRVWAFIGAVLGLVLLCATSGWAQISSGTGAIQGVVTDPQGASVAGAKVTLTNTDTGVQTAEGTSKTDGSFVFPLLPPGNYKITIQAPGFKATVLSDIKVEVTKVTVANATLQLGEVSSEVTVSESAIQVDTRTATTGDVIEGTQIRSIPLPTRNFLDLTTLQFGVSARIQSAATVGRGAPILDVAGSRATVNNFVLDGVDANNFGSNSLSTVPVPNPDAVGEFRVNTSMYDASQGRGSGGNINVVLQSGTNKFHGGVFDFYRSNSMNANDFFLNAQGKPRPVLLQNQFGGEVGGPIPKVKDTFWFFSYQGTRQKNGVSSLVSGSQPVLPARTTGMTEATYAAALSTAFGVPVANIDPVAVNLLLQPGQYNGYLYPSGTGAAVGSIGLLAISLPTIYNEDQYVGTVDRNLFHNNHLSAQVFWADITQFAQTGGGVSLGQGINNPAKTEHAAISDTHTFTPNVVNELSVGFTDIKSANDSTENVTAAQVGMSRWNSAVVPGIPALSISGLLSFGGPGVNSVTHGGVASITLGDTLSWSRGKHTLRFGGEMRRYRWNYENDYGTRGSLSFPSFTSYLTGTPNRVQVDVGIFYKNYRARDFDGFIQDDYHVMKKLTLNLGLRYDHMGFPIDLNHRIGNFDPSLVTAACIASGGGNCVDQGFVSPADLPGPQATPGVTENTLEKTSKLNFAPRVGFAYDVFGNGKLAVRSGFGIYNIRTSGQTVLQLIASPPWVEQYLASGTGIVGNDVLAQPFPANLPQASQFPILPQIGQFSGFSAAGVPLFTNADGSKGVPQSLFGFTRQQLTPYIEEYNLDIQYALSKTWVIETGYIGSHGVKLLVEPSLNQALLVNSSNAITYSNATLGSYTVNTDSNSNATIRAPVPGFSPAGLFLVTNQGLSRYNAFILEVRHSFANSFQFKMDYTFSHSVDNDSGPSGSDLDSFTGNQLIPSLNTGVSDFNQPHRIVFTYVWDIPGPKSGWRSEVIGGWGLSGVYTLQSGLPFSITSTPGGGLAGLNGSVTLRASPGVSCTGPLVTPGPVTQNINNYLNAACWAPVTNLPNGSLLTFSNPQQGFGTQTYTIGGATGDVSGGSLFGTVPRNLIQGPFEQRFDMALLKNVPLHMIGEQGNLQFRLETFKLFNNTIFSNPQANISNGNFGHIVSTLDGTGRVLQLGLKLNF